MDVQQTEHGENRFYISLESDSEREMDMDNAVMQSLLQMSLSCHQTSGWSLHPTRASTMHKKYIMDV